MMDGTDQDSGRNGAYRVLARKYRPQSFADLIGQEPMVRTLTNAFRTGRIAQAYMLTGVRGVGKTTTARILARALNYTVPGKVDQPTIDMDQLGEHCAAIMEGRHIDVIEMDAASHTGIDDIREIIEASRYRPVVARYKVYIIDEVHMLSKAAFNGLLKTLEEPPPHVKFIFATTEVRKVPVTVLSRCQRFDLRRIEAGRLAELMRGIAAKEGIAIAEEALRLIARAAEGSARDALSILDQAIAHAGGTVEAEAVRAMLGLADRAHVIDLFEEVMRGDIASALARLKQLYDVGADPAVILEDLAAFTHLVTRLKLAPSELADEALSEEERARGRMFADKLSLRILARTWQMLLKGIEETREASRPLAAADMVLVRLAHAADLPTPDEALRLLKDGAGREAPASPAVPAASASPTAFASSSMGSRAPMSGADPRPRMAASGGAGSARAAAQASVQPLSAAAARPLAPPSIVPVAASPPRASSVPRLDRFEDLVAIAATKRELKLKHALEHFVRVIRFEPGQIEIALTEEADPRFAGELSAKLEEWSGRRWMVAVAAEAARQTIAEERRAAQARLMSDARADPVVAAVLARFPGAEIVDVRARSGEGDTMSEQPVEPVLASELSDDGEWELEP
jgi:DNA polymerase-3 subunit gamma/tau